MCAWNDESCWSASPCQQRAVRRQKHTVSAGRTSSVMPLSERRYSQQPPAAQLACSYTSTVDSDAAKRTDCYATGGCLTEENPCICCYIIQQAAHLWLADVGTV